ncbi:MAG: dipeptide epimerase [Candidatus Omnitrophota bacterium]
MNTFIKNVKVSVVKAPLIQSFRTAKGTHDFLENIFFTITLTDGTKGFGEAAVAQHITGETIEQTLRHLRSIKNEIIGKEIFDYLAISLSLYGRFSANRCAIAAVEMALLDALTRKINVPLWRFFGPSPKKITSDVTIVIADLNETEKMTQRFFRQGFRAFKIKVGRDFDLDIKRVLLIKKIIRNCEFYIDANQGYSADETLSFVKTLRRFKAIPSLIEQPVPKKDWEGLKKVTRLSKIAVCADESVSTLVDANKAIREKACHAVNIKPMKFGLLQAREVAHLCKANRIKLMMGGMMETSLAMTASAHLAAGLGYFDFIDLDTPFFIKGKYAGSPYLSHSGTYDLSSAKPGIGIQFK